VEIKMGYCTITDIENIIAQSLTSATAPTPDALNSYSSLLNVGNTLDKNLITDSTVDSYIRISDSQIDAHLSELYKTPLSEQTSAEAFLFSAIDPHNQYIVLNKVVPLTSGDQIILYQVTDGRTERCIIDEIIAPTVFSTVDEVQYYFNIDSRVVQVGYPNPVKWISARMSAANIYDKYFSAEVSPSTSKFGDMIREIANNDLNNILNGTTILHGQQRIGRRFYNSNLVDQYGLPRGAALDKSMKQIK
jgi:hypothetical protein